MDRCLAAGGHRRGGHGLPALAGLLADLHLE